MLLQLNIQNFAIVRNLDLEWHQGMTTITGETGAGKSIAIDALGLCLGERATTNTVRPNCKKAELSATFDIANNTAAQNWLKTKDLNLDDDCILRRIISAEGRSKSYINGSQVPLIQLKELGQLLINIHGQHDHQLLTKASEQRKIVDDYADHCHLLDEVKYYYKQWQQLNNELKSLQDSQLQREAKRQLLQYQVTELDEFSLQEDEFLQLEGDYKRHSHAQSILTESLIALDILSTNEQFNVNDSLGKAIENLSAFSHIDADLANITNLLQESLIQIEEASNDLRHYHDKLELDPQAYAAIEERYSLALQLAKKHQVAPEKLPQLHASLSQELANISQDESRVLTVIDEIEKTEQAYFQSAEKLSKSRQKSAKALSKKISTSLHELNMEHGKFHVDITHNDSKALSPNGIDEVLFLVSLNPGQALEAMHKVASGGELSRISLAMQVILADKVVTPALIFDEVDVGISGPTAAMVGTKLQQLAQKTQVICVTHLPQVACKGHQQFFVAKLTDGAHTETTVTELSQQSRVKEIARLLAGDKITDNSLANAAELLAG
ncbi:DNA repair protein RecN [Thalassotalea sp. PLHSN55]|uniref:DNA repair protein RecN n=1 Tax=Thalassotalea sp. PLHSN55 TaxID=3435888 RepID=UPI003F82488E